jgi:hypothetical protein
MKHDEDFEAVEWMIRQGSSSWMGPTPQAGRARWSAAARRRPVGLVLRGTAAGVLFTSLALFSVVAVAASMSPGGISSVPRAVSDVLAQKTQRAPLAPASVSPAPARQAEQSPRPAVSPASPAGGVAHPPTPRPVSAGEDEGTPPPVAPVVPHVAPTTGGPSPTPSRPPDD